MKHFILFHSPKRGVMSATFELQLTPSLMFHSPKRGVMSATLLSRRIIMIMGFIPLNGASCLQREGRQLPAVGDVSFP